MQPIDRALAIASRAFVALLPLAIVITSLNPAAHRSGFADGVVERFGLSGTGAAAVRRLFATPDQVRGGVTVLGVLVLLYSVLGFARILGRLYENAWRLPPGGVRGLARGLIWVAAAAGFVGFVLPVRGAVAAHAGHPVAVGLLLITSACCWLVTPWLLLAGRVPLRSLLPTAILTSVAMTVAWAVSAIYMPHALTVSANRYGLVGVAFTFVSWLTGIALGVLVAAAIGAVTAERWLQDAPPAGCRPIPPT